MIFPFESLVLDQRQFGLLVAVLIGFGFGFVLERAGFGRSTKLAAQFYLRDMTVFKVMFSAIVTAMLGLVIAASLGLTDLALISRSIASWTWIWPMLFGGLVLGVGFIISGYCPGTSLVAAGSGNVDGMFAVAGVVTGTYLYSELLRIPAFAAFHVSGEIGPVFLYELLGIPAQLLAAIVALAAIGAFFGAEKVEQWIAKRNAKTRIAPPRRLAFATIATLAVVSIAMIAVPHETAAGGTAKMAEVSAETLAHRIVDEPWNVRVIDIRTAEKFAAGRLPGSENVAPGAVKELALEIVPHQREIVVVSDSPDLPQEFLSYRGKVAILRGGFEAWRHYALVPPVAPQSSEPAAMEAFLFRNALHQRLTGTREAAPVPAAGAKPGVARPKKKGGGCSA